MKIKYLAFVLAIAIVICSCSDKKEVRVLRLGHSLDTKHPVHLAMLVLQEELEKKSNGKLKLAIYPNSQLGGERETLELLQIGSLDITKVSAGVLENFIPEYKVFSVPYLFRDIDHCHAIYDGAIGQKLLKNGDKFKLRGLTFYDAGSRNFYTKDGPINSPTDLKDQKIRVMKSNMAIEMMNDLDASPTPISFGELYTALQQGVVQGAENNIPSFYTSKHFEVCKYLSIDEHTSIPDVLVVSIDTYNSLSSQEKKWLKEATTASKLAQRELWQLSEKESLQSAIDGGVKVNYPDKEPFRKATQDFYKIFDGDKEMQELIKDIKAN